MRTLFLLLLVAASPATSLSQGTAQVRVQDLVLLDGAAPIQLTGYGLVVGLDRTGDRATGARGAPYTVQSIVNMLQRFGIAVDPNAIQARNAAAVMVTTLLDPFSGPGVQVDVTLSALGDARSLTGGVLLQTPMVDPTTGQVFVMAQGPVSTGAVSAQSGGSSVQAGHANTGRVPGGGLVVNTPTLRLDNNGQELRLRLRRPNFMQAQRIANIVNTTYGETATVEHAGLIRVTVPQGIGGLPGFMASLQDLRIAVDAPARFVINERTGTIVAGGNVRISEVMVTYGSLVISTQADQFVSQPAAFSEGTTVQGTVNTAAIQEGVARSVVLPPNTDVATLAATLNELGLTARDIIAVFQAIDRAGALQGELVIL